MIRRLTPASSKWVAYEWRSVWTGARLVIPLFRSARRKALCRLLRVTGRRRVRGCATVRDESARETPRAIGASASMRGAVAGSAQATGRTGPVSLCRECGAPSGHCQYRPPGVARLRGAGVRPRRSSSSTRGRRGSARAPARAGLRRGPTPRATFSRGRAGRIATSSTGA